MVGRLVAVGVIAMAAACAPIAPPPAPPSPLGAYPDTSGFLQCVPFARTVSGIELHGDAWTWWTQAAGRYDRGSEPKTGAVLAFRRSNKLKLGHVAVVFKVMGPRRILLTHANWGNDGETRGVVHERQPAMDVSPRNDWSEVRLLNRQGEWGSAYAAHGFIYRPAGAQAAGL